MNSYEELIYSLIYNCNREIKPEEMKLLNEADAIYNDYNNIANDFGCPLYVVFQVLKTRKFYGCALDVYKQFFLDKLYWDEKYEVWTLNAFMFRFKLKDYKKTWWLKEDKSE